MMRIIYTLIYTGVCITFLRTTSKKKVSNILWETYFGFIMSETTEYDVYLARKCDVDDIISTHKFMQINLRKKNTKNKICFLN